MKIVFFDDNQNSKEFETEAQDLKYLFQIAGNLSDFESKKVELAIDKFSEKNEIQSIEMQEKEI